jgi:hypothetical protein
MADTVDTADSLSPANEAEEPEEEGRKAEAPEAEQPQAEQPEAEQPEADAETPKDARGLRELFEQLGRELSDLGLAEAQLEAARNLPEVRRAARDIAGVLVVVVAALTAFAFLNVAAVNGLSRVLATWLAALVVAAFWTVVGGVLLFGFMGRARRWLWWIAVKAPPTEAVEELKRERDTAAKDARDTIERLGPAIAIEIALAAVPKAGEVVGGVASAVVGVGGSVGDVAGSVGDVAGTVGDVAGTVGDVGGSVREASSEIVEVFSEDGPGGGVVSQVWNVALVPGRFGIRVATTVLRRGKPVD